MVTEVALLVALAALGWIWRDRARAWRELALARADARTDALTGLANRRELMRDLEAAVAGRGPCTVAVFDLDGFKRYNDTFGHLAGDALIARLSKRLATAIRHEGRAYRLGGDEFCVILDAASGTAADDAVWRAATALREPLDGFLVDASCGAVTLPGEAASAAEALHLADTRMYRDKERRPDSASRQARDVLLAALAEREPGLHSHTLEVARLARGVARRLGLDQQDREVVVRAAEMHDIGKVSIPDAVLSKSGPLEPHEAAWMRRHTAIGEDILRVAPSLASVAAVVRASHERWDGNGYPDGLAGEAIPLAARIVAVCDAYSAMRQDRAYGDVLGHGEAVAELRRCAGSQFDASIVEAFCAVHAGDTGTHRTIAVAA